MEGELLFNVRKVSTVTIKHPHANAKSELFFCIKQKVFRIVQLLTIPTSKNSEEIDYFGHSWWACCLNKFIALKFKIFDILFHCCLIHWKDFIIISPKKFLHTVNM